MKTNIPIAKVDLNKHEINSVLGPLKNGWLVQGPKVKEFEKKWSDFTKSKFSIAVTSCTSALQLSLLALGFKPGDEAIVPAFTWISTANVVEQLGGKVIFCDINLESFNIDYQQIEKKITSKTKFIIPVHLFGFPADMSEILKIAKKYNLKIVEDAACGFGTKINEKHVGLFGNAGCFSFHPRKSITTGEGGMITTQNSKIAERLYRLRDHGATLSDLQRHSGPKPYLLSDHLDAGYNQRMTDIQGALGSEQMNRANSILNQRKIIANKYISKLKNIDWLILPIKKDGYIHSFQSFACLFKPKNLNFKNLNEIKNLRNSFMDKLLRSGISTRPATHSVIDLSYYKNNYRIDPKDFPNTTYAANASISLPLYNKLKDSEITFITEEIKKGYE